MSTETVIKYNNKGQNNVYPYDSAADFSSGAFKSAIYERPSEETIDISQFADGVNFYMRGDDLVPFSNYGPDVQAAAKWESSLNFTYSKITNPVISFNGNSPGGNGLSGHNGPIIFKPEIFGSGNQFRVEFSLFNNASLATVEGTIGEVKSANEYIKVLTNGYGEIVLRVKQRDGAIKNYNTIDFQPAIGSKTTISFSYIRAGNNGFCYLHINGVKIYQSVGIIFSDNTSITDFNLGTWPSSSFRYSRLRIYNVVGSFSDYIPDPNFPEQGYPARKLRVLDKDFPRSVKFLSELNILPTNGIRVQVQGHRYANGSGSWVPSSAETHGQATPIGVAKNHIEKLQIDSENVYIDIYWPQTSNEFVLSSVSYTAMSSYFHEVVNLTTTGNGIRATKILGFNYRAYPEENAFIYMWVIIDGVWYYYNLNTSAWEPSNKSYAEANTPNVQKLYAKDIPFDGAIKKIDHATSLYIPIGFAEQNQSLQSPSVEWVSYEVEEHSVELPPPHETTLCGLMRNVGTDPSTNKLIVRVENTHVHPGTIVHPREYHIEPDNSAGAFSKGLYETETINEVYGFYQEYEKISSRTGEEKTCEDLIGYSVYPISEKIRLYDLPLGATEDEAKKHYAIWLAAGKPSPIPDGLFDECDDSIVSGDCLVEYVKQLIQENQGVSGLFRGDVVSGVQMRAVPAVSDNDYVNNRETGTVWKYSNGNWEDTFFEFSTAIQDDINAKAPSDRTFRGIVYNYTALKELEILSDTDYAVNSETGTVWQYDARTDDWIDTDKPFNAAGAATVKIDFENVTQVMTNYATYVDRPIVEAWTLIDNSYSIAEPSIAFDEAQKLITVDFGGSFVSGYLILK